MIDSARLIVSHGISCRTVPAAEFFGTNRSWFALPGLAYTTERQISHLIVAYNTGGRLTRFYLWRRVLAMLPMHIYDRSIYSASINLRSVPCS